MSEEGTEQVVITITRVDQRPDFKGATIAGKDRARHPLVFLLRSNTKIRRLSPTDSTQTLGQILAADVSQLPFFLNTEVLITWRLDLATSEKLAVKVTLLQ